jgi:hypothetical protein
MLDRTRGRWVVRIVTSDVGLAVEWREGGEWLDLDRRGGGANGI